MSTLFTVQEEMHLSPTPQEARSMLDPIGMAENIPRLAHVALQKIWPSDREYTHLQMDYEVTWKLPRFLSAYFPANQDIINVLTLTGDETKAQSISCGQYMSNNVPRSSRFLLEIIQNFLVGHDDSM
jgi:hypothetical protein